MKITKGKIRSLNFSIFLSLFLAIATLPTTVDARQSCKDNGFCRSICGSPGDTPCTYAWCDDGIGTELCMSGGEQDIPEECGGGLLC